jgi:hypothetical protein
MEKYRLQKEFSQVVVQSSVPQKSSSVFPVLGAGSKSSTSSSTSSYGTYARNLYSISDEELIEKLRGHVVEERRVVTAILEYLREVDRRRLYADAGYPSLWDFCIRELGYSEGAASRRINSMRLLRDLPELKKDIEEGKHSLSSLAQAHKFFRTEEKHNNQKLSTEEKMEVLQKLENKTSLECEKELIQLSSVPMQISRPQKERLLDEKHIELKLVIDQKLLLKLKRVQALRSHASPSMNYSELLNFMADEILKRLDPLEKTKQKRPQQPRASLEPQSFVKEQSSQDPQVSTKPPASVKQQTFIKSPVSVNPQTSTKLQTSGKPQTVTESLSVIKKDVSNANRPLVRGPSSQFERVPIPESVRQSVWVRDQGRCGHRDPKTGRVCGSQHFLEIDHIRPVSMGGGNDPSNLRLRCRGHNQRYAFQMEHPKLAKVER